MPKVSYKDLQDSLFRTTADRNRECKRAEEAEGKLKLCRDGNEILHLNIKNLETGQEILLRREKEAQHKLLAAEKERDLEKEKVQKLLREEHPVKTIEKIVEKEVLPNGLQILLFIFIFTQAFLVMRAWEKVKQLQQPILSPYPVYVTEHTIDLTQPYLACMAHNKAATDAWRENERELRKLRKEKHENETDRKID